MVIDKDELFRFKIGEITSDKTKYEAVKLLLVLKLLNKNSNSLTKIRIYTEFEIDMDMVCSVYYENTRTKEAKAYDIYSNQQRVWMDEKKRKYADWKVPFMDSSDWIPINLNEFTNNLDEIYAKLEGYI